jgi:serine/threonine protein kinase
MLMEVFYTFPQRISVDLWAVGCVVVELADRAPLFPGRDEAEQRSLLYRDIALYVDERLAPYGALHLDMLSLVLALVQPDPSMRCSAADALGHPYLTNILSTNYPAQLWTTVIPEIATDLLSAPIHVAVEREFNVCVPISTMDAGYPFDAQSHLSDDLTGSPCLSVPKSCKVSIDWPT